MKLIIISIAIIMLLILVPKVTSFSTVTLENETSIKVTDQTNALISVIALPKNKIDSGSFSEIKVKISNRIPNIINLQGDSVNIDGIIFTYDSAVIREGEEQEITIKVTTEPSFQIREDNLYQVPLTFQWENGSAIIPTEIIIEVID